MELTPNDVPVLVELNTQIDWNQETLQNIIKIILAIVKSIAKVDLEGKIEVLDLKNISKLYLQFNIPKVFYDLIKMAVTVGPKSLSGVKSFFVNDRIPFEYPTDRASVFELEVGKRRRGPVIAPKLKDTRSYLEIEKIWNHPSFETLEPVLCGVMDTGVSQANGEPWPWLGDRLVAARSFCSTSGYTHRDYIGHGSSCAQEIAGGLWPDHEDLRGLNPKALIASAQIFDANGYTYTSWILQAADWLAGLEVTYKEKKYRVKVMNNSWGSDQKGDGTDQLSTTFDELWKKGIYVEFSMGNAGTTGSPCDGTIGIPSCNRLCVKTGATSGIKELNGSTKSRTMSFSSRPKTADGRTYPDIRGCMFPGYQIAFHDPRMTGKSGTSFSGPLHCGLATLIYGLAGLIFTNDMVWGFIESTCVSLGYENEYPKEAAVCLQMAGEGRPYAAFLKALGEEDGNGNGDGNGDEQPGELFPRSLIDHASYLVRVSDGPWSESDPNPTGDENDTVARYQWKFTPRANGTHDFKPLVTLAGPTVGTVVVDPDNGNPEPNPPNDEGHDHRENTDDPGTPEPRIVSPKQGEELERGKVYIVTLEVYKKTKS